MLLKKKKKVKKKKKKKAKAHERRAKLIKLAPVFQKVDNAIGWSRIGIHYLW